MNSENLSDALGKTLVVIPAFNESATIAAVIREIRQAVPSARCLVVDDCSTDDTAAIARREGVDVARLPFNLGVGGAMRVGFRFARAAGLDNVVQVDGDGQHDPANVSALVAGLDDADIVLGARFAGTGDYAVSGPRRWAMRVLAVILSRVTRARLTDTTSGFKASGPKAVRLFAEHYPAEYLGDTIEALVIAARAGCTVTQIPVAMRPRAGGVPSSNVVQSVVYLARASMALFFALVRPASTYRSVES